MTTDDLTDEPEDPGNLRRLLQEQHEARASAERELAELRSREAFRSAGLDPALPLHAAVMKGYDGPYEADAVQQYVSGLGMTPSAPAPAPAPPPVNPDDQDALVRIGQAAMGDGQPPAEPDRRNQLREEMEAAYRRKAPKSELERIANEFSRAGGYRVLGDVPGSPDW